MPTDLLFEGCWSRCWNQINSHNASIICGGKSSSVDQESRPPPTCSSPPPTCQSPARGLCSYTHPDENDESGDYHEKQNAEQDWFRRTRFFQFDILSDRHPFHVLEALAWGAAVVTGFRMSHDCRRIGRLESRERSRCWVRRVQNYASAVWNQQFDVSRFDASLVGWTSSVRSVLPHCSGKMSPSIHHLVGDAGNAGGSSSGQDQPSAQNEKPSLKNIELPANLEMDEALHQWQQINRDQCGLRQNAYGMVLAKKRDFDGAIKAWTEAAHNFGYAKAYYNLGICHEQGLGVEQNLEEAKTFYLKAATEGHAMASFNLAMICLKAGDVEQALKHLESAAGRGLKEAQRELGVLYTEPPQRDMKKAASLFEAAAAQKDARASYFLGVCYENGWGVERSEFRASELYRQSAMAGYIGAVHNLELFFSDDFEGPSSDSAAGTDSSSTSSQDSEPLLGFADRYNDQLSPVVPIVPRLRDSFDPSSPSARKKSTVSDRVDYDSDSSQGSVENSRLPRLVISADGPKRIGSSTESRSRYFSSTSSDEGIETADHSPVELEKWLVPGAQFAGFSDFLTKLN